MEGSKSLVTASRRTSKTTSKRGKGLPRRAQDLSKEELLLTLQKKKECNARALKIVERMLESKVEEEWFLNVVQEINQSHLQDICEERAISKLCGYPLCSNNLSNIPSQQYHISTKSNKVYDITERKNFCSNKCFMACKFIKDQMFTSPLWLRDIEPSVTFKLMPLVGTSGRAGDEVNVQVERISKSEVKKICQEERATQKSIVDALDDLHLAACFQGSGKATGLVSLKPHVKDEKSSEEEPVSYQSHVSTKNSERSHSLEGNENCSLALEKDSNTCISTNICRSKSGNDVDSAKEQNEEPTCMLEDETAAVEKTTAQSTDFIGIKIFKSSEGKDTIGTESLLNIDSKRSALTNSESPLATQTEKCDEKKCSGDLSLESSTGQIMERQSIMKEEKPMNRCFHSPNVELKPKPERFSLSEPESILVQEASQDCKNAATIVRQSQTMDNVGVIKTGKRKESYALQKSPKSETKVQSDSSSRKSLPTVANVEKCMQEWFTMETMCFVFGESALKVMLEHKGESIQAHYRALSSLTWDQEKHERFLAICKRLKLFEIEEKTYDSQVMKSDPDSERKPLPDYSTLKREAEAMELKIRAFYNGKMEIDEKRVSFAEDVVDDPAQPANTNEPHIPLVHLHSQRALRKRIVLDGLNRVLPDILRTFGMRPSELTSSVRGLVSTFSLSSTNITFKPQEWSLLGLIVIKLLALREPDLKQCLQHEQSKTYLTLMLMSFKQEPEYLDRVLSWLTDIDSLLTRPETSSEI